MPYVVRIERRPIGTGLPAWYMSIHVDLASNLGALGSGHSTQLHPTLEAGINAWATELRRHDDDGFIWRGAHYPNADALIAAVHTATW